MARGKTTDPHVKAAIIAALLAGQGVNEVAARYKVSKATVSRIKVNFSESDLKRVETEKKEALGDLIAEYLRQNLHTLSVQAEHARDKAWLQRQGAESLAVLHDKLADKAIRLLEAIEPAGEPDSV